MTRSAGGFFFTLAFVTLALVIGIGLASASDHDLSVQASKTDQGSKRQLPQREAMPGWLSETDLFEDILQKRFAPTYVPFEINAPLWSDGAGKLRLIRLPEGEFLAWSDSLFTYPNGTILVKNFLVDTLADGTAPEMFLETRFLLKDSTGWHGFTYKWERSGRDAELVSAAGKDTLYTRRRGAVEEQVRWTFPSRLDCKTCHIPQAREVLGFLPPQLNRAATAGTIPGHQFAYLKSRGILGSDAPDDGMATHYWPGWADSDASIQARSRAYLASNCSQCHSPEGIRQNATFVNFSFNYFRHDDTLDYLDARPTSASWGDSVWLIASGRPSQSLILRRLEARGLGQMPPLATHVPDTLAIKNLKAWVASLTPASIKKSAAKPALQHPQSGRLDALGRPQPEDARKERLSPTFSIPLH